MVTKDKVKEKPVQKNKPLKLKQKLYVSLVPSESEGIIIKYDTGDLSASVILPPKKRRVNLNIRNILSRDYRLGEKSQNLFRTKADSLGHLLNQDPVKLEIDTPSLLWQMDFLPTTDLGESNHLDDYHDEEAGIKIYEITSIKEKSFNAKVYRISNVYAEGEVCWPDEFPSSIRAANNEFWDSSFDGDAVDAVFDKSFKKQWSDEVDKLLKKVNDLTAKQIETAFKENLELLFKVSGTTSGNIQNQVFGKKHLAAKKQDGFFVIPVGAENDRINFNLGDTPVASEYIRSWEPNNVTSFDWMEGFTSNCYDEFSRNYDDEEHEYRVVKLIIGFAKYLLTEDCWELTIPSRNPNGKPFKIKVTEDSLSF